MKSAPKFKFSLLGLLGAFILSASSAYADCPPGMHWDATAMKCVCDAGSHWDEGMQMCMPDDTPVDCPAGTHWSVEEDQCVPNNCKASEHWDQAMKMCMPNTAGGPEECGPDEYWDEAMQMCMPNGKTSLSFHANQFLVGLTGSGPRGRTAFSAPNMFMLTFQQRISACDSVRVEWMGTTDKWTTPTKGTPLLLQTGESNKNGVPFIDAQHPHSSPIMGLTFAVVHCMGKMGDDSFTLSFSPRGEATAGPLAFMHRPSAEGNPNAPLSHHLQDVFHIMSTVLAAKLEIGKWSIEGSMFSGREPSPTEVNLDMHPFDSYGLRLARKITPNVTVGVSAASVLEQHRIAPDQIPEDAQRSTLIAAWVSTQNKLKSGTLKTSTIFGQAREDKEQLNSFLEEMSYKFGKLEQNNVFSRFEILQRTPDQLQINMIGDAKKAEWVKALTLGYERSIGSKKGASVFAGGSLTKAFVPTAFKATYGGNPLSAEVHLRILFKKNRSWGKVSK